MASMTSRLRNTLRHYSTILSPNSTTPLTSKEKSRSALRLLKSETNPETILSICRAASLSPDSHLDRLALSTAVSKLTAGKNFDVLRQFLDELLQSRSDLQNERFVSHAIVLYGQANMMNQALDTFKFMRENLNIVASAKSLNALLFAAILAKNHKEVTRIYLNFPRIYDIKPDVETYNLVIKSFAESGLSNSVFSILDEMDRSNVKPNVVTINNAISGFYNEKKFDEVGKLLNLMEERYKLYPSLSTYNVRIQSLCKLKRSNEAKALFQGMITSGRKPNSVSYYHLMNGFCREGNLEEAKGLFADMKKRGFKVDGQCYFTLVYFLCEGDEFEWALDIAKECIAKGWVPNFTTMKKLVNGLVGVSKVDDAKELIKEIKEKFAEKSDRWDEIEAGLSPPQE
ncbi:putative pentatricopeptide [Medicago truncatula]|uniref:Membrane-associated salt-inducible protein n=2 Tax=Medicago truncatula TaxID=3880 RepID=A0A072V673_MEDTR|nr:pentatricopeptide repeat-containing protein At1g61870, mitochondrial [Medicago truncatula]KEH36828.1 membrane-associated salt-inducible protein [Medicago truncatula]RHN72484.1 putative pentatricopeptide [Medicago truncatula]